MSTIVEMADRLHKGRPLLRHSVSLVPTHGRRFPLTVHDTSVALHAEAFRMLHEEQQAFRRSDCEIGRLDQTIGYSLRHGSGETREGAVRD